MPLAVAAQPEEPEGAALCPGILASARFHLHTSLLEGVNNRIKVIKRMAYGFRDSDYFFLKIKAAFSGKFDGPKKGPEVPVLSIRAPPALGAMYCHGCSGHSRKPGNCFLLVILEHIQLLRSEVIPRLAFQYGSYLVVSQRVAQRSVDHPAFIQFGRGRRRRLLDCTWCRYIGLLRSPRCSVRRARFDSLLVLPQLSVIIPSPEWVCSPSPAT